MGGASTIDQNLRAKAMLGNHQHFDGQSTFQISAKQLPSCLCRDSRIMEAQLKYPSFSIIFDGQSTPHQDFEKCLRLILSYNVEISPTRDVDVWMDPTTMV